MLFRAVLVGLGLDALLLAAAGLYYLLTKDSDPLHLLLIVSTAAWALLMTVLRWDP